MHKKVWILNHYATWMYYDKAGRHHWFAKSLQSKYQHNVRIFCSNTFHNKKDSIRFKGKSQTKKSDNISYTFVKTFSSTGNGIKRVLNMFQFYLNLKKVMRKNIHLDDKPDIIFASSVHPLTLVAGIKIGKKYKIPVICEIRDLWPEAIFAINRAREKSLVGKILIKGEKWIYKNSNAIIFTKEGDSDYLKEKKWDLSSGGEIDLDKCYYINNGLNLIDFTDSIANNTFIDNDLISDKFKVIYAGAIRPVNNIDKLINAARLLKDFKDIVFLIYGEGNEKTYIAGLINEYNLNNVILKGFVEKKYIPYILSNSSVNILNYSQTRYNWSRGNSSNKLFEYMASSKPIISTVKIGYSPFKKYEIGYEIENASPKELSEAILKVRGLPKEQYQSFSRNAYEAAKDFDFNTHTEKLNEIIERLLEGKND